MEQIEQNRQRQNDILVASTAADTGHFENLARFGPIGIQRERSGGSGVVLKRDLQDLQNVDPDGIERFSTPKPEVRLISGIGERGE